MQRARAVVWLVAAAALSGCGGSASDDDFAGAPPLGPTTTADQGDGGQRGSGGGNGSDKSGEDDDGSGENGKSEEGDAGGGGPSASNEITLGPAFGPGSLDFGSLPEVGLSQSMTLTIRNGPEIGREGKLVFVSRVISISVRGEHASDFPITGDCRDGLELAPNAACTLIVTFAPTATGNREAVLSIASDPPAHISLRLVGRVGRLIEPDPSTITEREDVVPP